MIFYSDGTDASTGATMVTRDGELRGPHSGAIGVMAGHLLVSGDLEGSMLVHPGAHVTLTGTIRGAIVILEGGSFIGEEGSSIVGATTGVVTFGRKHGASD